MGPWKGLRPETALAWAWGLRVEANQYYSISGPGLLGWVSRLAVLPSALWGPSP